VLTDNFIVFEQNQVLETYLPYVTTLHGLTCNLVIFLYLYMHVLTV